MYIYIYIYIHTYIILYVYIYIYRERERCKYKRYELTNVPVPQRPALCWNSAASEARSRTSTLTRRAPEKSEGRSLAHASYGGLASEQEIVVIVAIAASLQIQVL